MYKIYEVLNDETILKLSHLTLTIKPYKKKKKKKGVIKK